MRSTRGMILAALTIGVTPLATWGKEDDAKRAKDILLKSRAAISRVKQVAYEVDYKATGYVRRWVKDVRGTVLVGENAAYDVPRFFLEITLPTEEGDPERYTVGCDGNEYFLVDNKTKTVHVDIDPAVLGSNAHTFTRVIFPEFNASEPYEKALEAEELELREDESVGGEDCHVIAVKGDSPTEVIWWISKKDHLPRRLRRVYKSEQQGEGVIEQTLTRLVANPPAQGDPFRIRVPEGFRKTDEFAP